MRLLRYKTFKKAQEIYNLLKEMPLEEATMVAFIVIYMLNDVRLKEMRKKDTLHKLFTETVENYVLLSALGGGQN